MIGQKNLLENMIEDIYKDKFPQFVILVGEEGSGKRTLCKELAKHWKFYYQCADTKVATIRDMIEFAYQTKKSGECLFCIPDAQSMSLQAKNSILKLVEEPPKYATFIMTVTDINSVLGTIKSRAIVYRMERYSYLELKEALSSITKGSVQDDERSKFVLDVSDNVKELSEALKIDPGAIHKHVSLVIDKADSLSLGNLLKSTKLMKVNDSEKNNDKLDIKMFFKVFIIECLKRLESEENVDEISEMIIETDSMLGELNIKGINKTMVYENWLLSIREIKEKYYEYAGH